MKEQMTRGVDTLGQGYLQTAMRQTDRHCTDGRKNSIVEKRNCMVELVTVKGLTDTGPGIMIDMIHMREILTEDRRKENMETGGV